jgi:hypothetical protein
MELIRRLGSCPYFSENALTIQILGLRKKAKKFLVLPALKGLLFNKMPPIYALLVTVIQNFCNHTVFFGTSLAGLLYC